MYFLTVSLCMLSSRAIPRMDSPLRFAFWTAFEEGPGCFQPICQGRSNLRPRGGAKVYHSG